jgi:hypothetical protein
MLKLGVGCFTRDMHTKIKINMPFETTPNKNGLIAKVRELN